MDNLELPRYVSTKIKRAVDHINELDALLKYWSEKCFVNVFTHNEEKTHYQLELVLKAEPPVDECAAVLGDLMHNLRSALDLWMSHQAGATEKDDEKDKVYFPICKNGNDFRKWKKTVRDRVDQALIETIRLHQPYVQQLSGRDWLLALTDLNNADKHRIMMSVDFGYTNNLSVEVSPLPPRTDLPNITYEPHMVTASKGGLVLDLKSDAPIDIDAPSVTMDAYFELDGTKHELIQNVRGFHYSVQRLLMTIQHQTAVQRGQAEAREAGDEPDLED